MQTTDHTELLKDTLAFLKKVQGNEYATDTQKLNTILQTLGHDINGVLSGDEFMVPRVTGYSKMA